MGGRGEKGRCTRAFACIGKLVGALETHRGAIIGGSNRIMHACMAA